jgi:DHA2 family multidrug resistance protein
VVTLYEMIGFTNNTAASTIVITGVIQGFAIGFIFVSLSTIAFTSLPAHLRTSGSAMLTLVRNMGSSVGIATVIAQLTSTTNYMHARLMENVTPFNDALRQAGALLDTATDQGRALLDMIVTQQATVIAYDNAFKLLMLFTLLTLPLLPFIGSSRGRRAERTAPAID